MERTKPRLRRSVAAVALLGVLASCALPSPTSNGIAVSALPEDNAEALMGVARTAEAEGDAQTALSLYQKAAQAAPGDIEPLLAAGRLAAANGQHNEAARAYQLAVQAQPNNLEARYGLGRALAAQDLPNAALKHFEAMLQVDRADPRAYNGMGIAYDLLGDHRQAQSHYRTGLAIDANSISLRNNLAYSLILSGDHGEAAGLLEQVVQSPGATQQSHRNLALAYNLMGRDEDSRAVVLGNDGVADIAQAVSSYQAAAAPSNSLSDSSDGTPQPLTAPQSGSALAAAAVAPAAAAQTVPETSSGPQTASVVEETVSFEADPQGPAPQSQTTYRHQDEPADVTPRYVSTPAAPQTSGPAAEILERAAAEAREDGETAGGLEAQAAVKRPSTEERRIVSYGQSGTQTVSYSLADAPSVRDLAAARGITNAPTLEDRFLNND